MEITKAKVRAMCARLSNWHWSPNHPSTYVIPDGSSVKGIGIIAERNYGAFNLAWAMSEDKWQTHEEQVKFITAFTHYQKITHHLINDVPVGDWLCLMRPHNFAWLVESSKLDAVDKLVLSIPTNKAMKMKAEHDAKL